MTEGKAVRFRARVDGKCFVCKLKIKEGQLVARCGAGYDSDRFAHSQCHPDREKS